MFNSKVLPFAKDKVIQWVYGICDGGDIVMNGCIKQKLTSDLYEALRNAIFNERRKLYIILQSKAS